MDKGRWMAAAVVAVVCFVTVASFLLALSHFFVAVLLNFGRHGDTPPAIREATNLLMFAGLAYLVAAGWVVYDRALRTPTPFVVLGAVLVVATTLAAWAQSRLRQLPDQASLPPWFLSLGTACALLALAAAWLRYRHSAVLAIAIVVAIAAACAAIVGILVLTARSNAGREPFPAGWIEPRSTVPDGHLRAARFQQPAANDPAWFVVAEPEGEGFEGDTDVSVWRIDAPGASTPPEFEYRAERNRIYAANALASSVSSWPDKPMPAHASVPLDAWSEEVMREASGW